MRFACLRPSQLVIGSTSGPDTEIVSTFAEEADKRASKSRAIDGWKEGASTWNNAWMVRPEMQAFQQAGIADRVYQFSNVARIGPDMIAYTLDMKGAGGLFRYDLNKKLEYRLMHRNGFAPQGLAARPSDGLLAFSVVNEQGGMNIAVGERDGVYHRTMTTGDSRDAAPTWWNDGTNDWLYFHSAGVYRNQQGIGLGLAPAAICRIGVNFGDVEVVLESEDTEYVQPRLDSQGTLYCIRRPFQKSGPRANDLLSLLLDIVCFPYRLARAVFYFLNFVSVMFARRPLVSRSLDPERQEQLTRLMIWGRAVETQKELNRAGREGRMRLVPSGWELVRQRPGEAIEVLANHVVCFDVGPNGEVVYSDGGGVYQWTAQGEKKVSALSHVLQLAVLG